MQEAEAGRVLSEGARALGLEVAPPQESKLLHLARLLGEWNARFNLTAIRDPGEVLTKHLLDSLSVAPHVAGGRVADVGTGAGFPGLPLAIVQPARSFTLIEATAKKARFVELAAHELGLDNVQVVNARAEAFKPPQRFDTVLARALGDLSEFIRFAGHLCARGGRLLAMKGRRPDEEIAAVRRPWRVAAVHSLTVPGLDAQRHLVVLERTADAARRSR